MSEKLEATEGRLEVRPHYFVFFLRAPRPDLAISLVIEVRPINQEIV